MFIQMLKVHYPKLTPQLLFNVLIFITGPNESLSDFVSLWYGFDQTVQPVFFAAAIWCLVCATVHICLDAWASLFSPPGSPSCSQIDIKGLHLQLSLLGCTTEVITAGQGSELWLKIETKRTEMDFKGKRSSDRLLF